MMSAEKRLLPALLPLLVVEGKVLLPLGTMNLRVEHSSK